jgi:aspartate-semialdehyde dehydrogenase
MYIGLVGPRGLVGEELLFLLKSKLNTIPKIFGKDSILDFSNLDLLFLCTPSDVSRKIANLAIKQNIQVIDLSSAFRKDPDIPLVLPAVNSYLINNHSRIISCPNCVVAIVLMVLFPLHQKYKITNLHMTTYQAASGKGRGGLEELVNKSGPNFFPHPLHENLFLHESNLLENGYSGEEDKIIHETKKILNEPNLKVNVVAVRVAVKRAHSIALNVSFEESPDDCIEILKNSSGIEFHPSPTPLLAEHKENVYYGRVRKDLSKKNSLDIWIVGDQLLRGAALTAFEIFKYLETQKNNPIKR